VTLPVLVIGAGLAGTVAAARLQARGVPVRVVADRPGATLLHGGGWQLGPDSLRAHHPTAEAALDDALDFTLVGLASLALTEGLFDLPDVEGTRRECEIAPATHAVVDGFGPRHAVADLAPLGHPFATMQGRGTVVTVEWPPYPDVFGRSFAAMAHRVEADPAEPARLIEALKRALKGARHEALLLPPVLGISRTEALRRQVADALGMPVGEALDTLPSTPGFRLHAALSAWLKAAGVTTQSARVVSISTDPLGVRIGDMLVPARAIVLATGRYLTGGLTMHPTVREPLADLPLSPAVPSNPLWGARADGPYDGRVFETGVGHDPGFRAIGLDGRPVHPDVFAVGDLLGGVDALTQGHATGLCLASAWVAASTIADGLAGREAT
jgi:anaerobic glycerol-3-phosphate dehydrogenase